MQITLVGHREPVPVQAGDCGAYKRTRGIVLACRTEVLNDCVIRRIDICS